MKKNETKTGSQHSGGLVFKHVEAIHGANEDCGNSRYQPRGPGAAGINKYQKKSKNCKQIIGIIN